MPVGLTTPCHLLSHHFRGHSVSHQHTAFFSPWLHCLYHVLLGHPLGILKALVYGFAAFCGTGVLQGLLQLCCVESFCTLLRKNQVLSNFSSLFVQSLSSSVGSGSVFQLLRLPEAKAESLVCVPIRSSSTNLQNSSLMNCGSMSVVILTGSPWVRNIFLRLAMTFSAVVDLKTSTSI